MKDARFVFKMRSLLIVVLTLMIGFNVNAQKKSVTGVVKDATGESIIGASVLEKGTNNGIMTNIDGKFALDVAPNATLVISYVGYKTQEIPVAGQNQFIVTLEEDTKMLQEVVAIGYGTVKKTDATGSVDVVSAKDLNRGGITTPQEMLVGKSAGVVINTDGGAPGAGASILIRGGSSLSASNKPLFVVDGVPISNDASSGSPNILSIINPNDIASFTILKDASATAIYGSRASNGVILITTKTGEKGSKMKITYNGTVSVSQPQKLLDVYSGDQIRNIALTHPELYDADSYDKFGSYNTNWQSEIFQNSFSQDHNLSITGSNKALPYRVSFGFSNKNGILLNTGQKQYIVSFGLNPSLLNDDLKININGKALSSHNNFGDAGAVGSATRMDPSQPVKDGNESTAGYFQWNNYGASLGTANPVSQALLVDNTSVVNRFIGNVEFNYTLPFLKDLHANLNLATDYSRGEGHNNKPATANNQILGTYVNGSLTNYNSTNTNNLLDFYLNYKKDLTSIKSTIDVTGGYSWQHFHNQSYSYTRDAKDPYTITSDSVVHDNALQLISFFGRVNYGLRDKYLLTLTIRDDGSSRFAPTNRWGLFPSAAFAWKIKDESFLKNVDFLSELKLRLGWGMTGQQDIGSNYFPYLATYTISQPGSYYLFDGQYIPTLRPEGYDPNIKWEQTTTKNIGLDFSFFNRRISGSLDYYDRVTDDLLEDITIPTGSNFSNHLYTNVGSLRNRGVEFGLNVIPVSTKDVSLNIGFNFTYNQNKILKLLTSDDPNYIGILYGDNFSGSYQVSRVGYPAYSFFVNKQVYDALGKPIEGLYTDLSGKGGTVSGNNADKYIYHNPQPDILMGLTLRFAYKNWDLFSSNRVSLGNYVYNKIASGASYDQMYQIGYWHNQPTELSNYNFVKRQFSSDYFVENASFYKMDNLSIGYNIDKIVKNVSARLSFTVQNVFTITKYTGTDPEVPGGVDDNFYPRPRTFMFGVNLGIN